MKKKWKLASEYLSEGKAYFSCDAVKAYNLNMSLYEELFKPRTLKEREYVGLEALEPIEGYTSWFSDNSSEENQLARSLALLFMAELDK